MAIARITSRLRTRKLLLHKREISRLDEATAKQGMTLVPTQLYLKNGRIKIEVGVARGKKMYDKREAEMKQNSGARNPSPVERTKSSSNALWSAVNDHLSQFRELN